MPAQRIRAWVMVSASGATLDAGNSIRAKGLKGREVLGPYDVVVEVVAKDTDDLFKHYITPINMLPEVSGCTTYLTVDEKTKEGELKEPFAYILIDATPPELVKVRDKVFENPEVQKADIVLGPFDIVAEVAVKSVEELIELLKRFIKTIGIVKTVTMLIFTP